MPDPLNRSLVVRCCQPCLHSARHQRDVVDSNRTMLRKLYLRCNNTSPHSEDVDVFWGGHGGLTRSIVIDTTQILRVPNIGCRRTNRQGISIIRVGPACMSTASSAGQINFFRGGRGHNVFAGQPKCSSRMCYNRKPGDFADFRFIAESV